MKDLEKMRADFEHEYALAVRENQINEKLQFAEIAIVGNSFGYKGKLQVSIRAKEGISKECAFGECLKKFGVTEILNDSMNYSISTYRYSHANHTEVTISWIHGDLFFFSSFPIDGREEDEDGEYLFCPDSREMTHDDFPHGMQFEHGKRFYFLRPSCTVTKYSNGGRKAENKFWIEDFVNFLIERYEKEI